MDKQKHQPSLFRWVAKLALAWQKIHQLCSRHHEIHQGLLGTGLLKNLHHFGDRKVGLLFLVLTEDYRSAGQLKQLSLFWHRSKHRRTPKTSKKLGELQQIGRLKTSRHLIYNFIFSDRTQTWEASPPRNPERHPHNDPRPHYSSRRASGPHQMGFLGQLAFDLGSRWPKGLWKT